jgi:hypothetical protein
MGQVALKNKLNETEKENVTISLKAGKGKGQKLYGISQRVEV